MSSLSEDYIPIDDWSEQFPELLDAIECHIKNYVKDEDVYPLRRLIFTTLREKKSDLLEDVDDDVIYKIYNRNMKDYINRKNK